MRRYPWAPLRQRLFATLGTHREAGGSVQQVGVPSMAAYLEVPLGRVQSWTRRGLTRDHAEDAAARLGEHPYVLWPEMRDDDIADAEAALRTCAAEDCTVRFVPTSHRQHYHQPKCRDRQKARRWRRSDKGREAQRRRRQRPEVAELNRQRRRAYYAENAEYERARQRRYDARRRQQRDEAA